MPRPLDVFRHEEIDYRVEFIETTHPNDDVECDVYRFYDDDSRDLAILYVKPQGKTPRQRILLGEKTLEGYISGSGQFYRNDDMHELPGYNKKEFLVQQGDIMQWHAGPDGLVCYELCIPPYRDGRFEDIEDE